MTLTPLQSGRCSPTRGPGFDSRAATYPVTTPGTRIMIEPNDSVKDKRLAVLEELAEILREVEQDMDETIDHVRQNIHIAENELRNVKEYNYCVRLALAQLSTVATRDKVASSETIERIEDLTNGLEEKAALPPQDQITR